ncbi:MAG: 3-dehydroquinate synthase [Ruminococcus sp.]|jgi:3-dehydroquinate synthase|nr:3-dehydroquinate synthase [Ruminococcus sp.]
MPQIINVNTRAPYKIYITDDELIPREIDFSKYTKAAIISDDNVWALYGEAVKASLKKRGLLVNRFVFPHGEASKNLNTVSRIYEFLDKGGITRSDLIVALGGGVTGDISGFAASTYLRGIDFLQMPTSLLAMVDSSIGGKTGVDIQSGKNLVGAFKQPIAVIINPKMLETLPYSYYIDGLGEIIKYAMIRSASLFEKLEAHTPSTLREILPEIISECVNIKREIVENDEFEKGERMLLNFGHTLGHAIEKLCNFTGISHGVAVALGMELISVAPMFSGEMAADDFTRLHNLLDKYGYFNIQTPEFDVTEILKAALNDKKRRGNDISIIICEKIGHGKIKKMPVSEFLNYSNNNLNE